MDNNLTKLSDETLQKMYYDAIEKVQIPHHTFGMKYYLLWCAVIIEIGKRQRVPGGKFGPKSK